MRMSVSTTLSLFRASEYFSGQWSFTRTIRCADSFAEIARIENGSARFDRVEDLERKGELLYSESGKLRMNGKESYLDVTRQYLYRSMTEESKMNVYFFNVHNESEHLKFFHTLHFRQDKEGIGLRATAEHLCIKDLYKVDVRLHNPFVFETRWEVRGPRKNNIISTTFKKMNGSKQ